MGELIDQKKTARKVALYRSLIAHLIGIVYIIAELSLGFKPNLKDK